MRLATRRRDSVSPPHRHPSLGRGGQGLARDQPCLSCYWIPAAAGGQLGRRRSTPPLHLPRVAEHGGRWISMERSSLEDEADSGWPLPLLR